jgi:hypothetical protein
VAALLFVLLYCIETELVGAVDWGSQFTNTTSPLLYPSGFVFHSITGDGPLRGVVAIASGAGGVRGYVGSPMLGDISLVDAVGKGTVQIVKNHPSWPRPFNGITAIRHSDIDRDIGTLSHVNKIAVVDCLLC